MGCRRSEALKPRENDCNVFFENISSTAVFRPLKVVHRNEYGAFVH